MQRPPERPQEVAQALLKRVAPFSPHRRRATFHTASPAVGASALLEGSEYVPCAITDRGIDAIQTLVTNRTRRQRVVGSTAGSHVVRMPGHAGAGSDCLDERSAQCCCWANVLRCLQSGTRRAGVPKWPVVWAAAPAGARGQPHPGWTGPYGPVGPPQRGAGSRTRVLRTPAGDRLRLTVAPGLSTDTAPPTLMFTGGTATGGCVRSC